MTQGKNFAQSWPQDDSNAAVSISVQALSIAALDVLAGVLLGYASARIYRCIGLRRAFDVNDSIALWPQLLLASTIAALVLRGAGIGPPGRLAAAAYVEKLAQRVVIVLALLLSLGLATATLDYMARPALLGWFVSFAGYVAGSRYAMMTVTGWHRPSERGREAVAVLGAPDVASSMAARLAPDADIVTVIDDLDEGDEFCSTDALNELRDLVSAGAIDTVILALDRDDGHDMSPLLEELKAVPVLLATCGDDFGSLPDQSSMRMLGGVPIRIVADRPMTAWDALQKTMLDQFGAMLLLIFVSPLMLLAAIAIVWEGAGPILFRQERSGWNGRPFTIYKFRTMRCVAGGAHPRQTERHDPRCTRIGAFLRRTSIDELPQLWNVLRGDMSLVGPRPHMEALHRNQRDGCQIIAEYAQRQRVKPGLTGWAQIHGARGAVKSSAQMRRRVQYDLYYIEHWSIWLDIKILAWTPLCVISSENAF